MKPTRLIVLCAAVASVLLCVMTVHWSNRVDALDARAQFMDPVTEEVGLRPTQLVPQFGQPLDAGGAQGTRRVEVI